VTYLNSTFFFVVEDFDVIISAVYALLGNVANRQCSSNSLREYAKDVFGKFDEFNRGYLTLEDFIAFCLKVKEKNYQKKNIYLFIFVF